MSNQEQSQFTNKDTFKPTGPTTSGGPGTDTNSQLLASLTRILGVKPKQDLTARAIEVMQQLKTVPAQPTATNVDENWATMQLITISRVVGLPPDKTMKDLVSFIQTKYGGK